MDNVQKLVDYCRENFDLQNAELGEEYNYPSLALALIDAVFSIRTRYTSTKNVVERFEKNYKVDKNYTISNLIKNMDDYGDIGDFARDILSNQKISGELKAENVYKWAKILQKNGIETKEDFNEKMNKDIEKELKSVKGQGGGVALKYLYMLCGDDGKCKPDTHLMNFLSELEVDGTQGIMEKAVEILKTDNEKMTVRLLDYMIWNYQKDK